MSLIYSPERMEIDLNGKLIRLTTKEAAVMELLWKTDGEVCSSDDFGVFIYGPEWYDLNINVGVIEKLVSRVRTRLSPHGHKFIKNINGSGWYLAQYEPNEVIVKVTPAEADLLRYFRSLSPMEQEMIMASRKMATTPAAHLRPSLPHKQPTLFDYAEATVH